MFTCQSCDAEFRDGVTCSVCKAHYDFPCAGLTEIGWRRMGERKQTTWKCAQCKPLSTSPRITTTGMPTLPAQPPLATALPAEVNLVTIMMEIRSLSARMDKIMGLAEDVKSIRAELEELKKRETDCDGLKSSLEFTDNRVTELTTRVDTMQLDVNNLAATKAELTAMRDRCSKLESLHNEYEQRSRLNNIEIKGVPFSNNENLFSIFESVGVTIGYNIPKDQINYIARVPSRNNEKNKNIICCVQNRYIKNDFVAAARKHKSEITANKLGLQGDSRIYINDHLTLQNKMLLNKTKHLAKERNFLYVWVVGCKILLKKNATSPTHHIRIEQDLKKIFP